MADTLLVRALKGKPKSLNLCNKKLDKVPKAIGKLDCVVHLQLRGNKLTSLPIELSHLFQVMWDEKTKCIERLISAGSNIFVNQTAVVLSSWFAEEGVWEGGGGQGLVLIHVSCVSPLRNRNRVSKS